MVWGKRRGGWWINGMGGMTVAGLLRSYGWWGRVLPWAKHRSSCNIKIFFKFSFCYGDQICGRWISSTMYLGCVFMEMSFFQDLYFLLQSCFNGTFPSGHALPPPQLSRDWQFVTILSQSFYHWVYITGFLSQGFFHSGQSHSRNCDQGGRFYFSFMPKGRSWKLLKNGLSKILAIFSSQN